MTPWTATRQAPLSMGFPGKYTGVKLPFPTSGDLPKPGMADGSTASADGFFTTEPPGKA